MIDMCLIHLSFCLTVPRNLIGSDLSHSDEKNTSSGLCELDFGRFFDLAHGAATARIHPLARGWKATQSLPMRMSLWIEIVPHVQEVLHTCPADPSYC